MCTLPPAEGTWVHRGKGRETNNNEDNEKAESSLYLIADGDMNHEGHYKIIISLNMHISNFKI
jgi:hypothetical protein